MDYRPGNVNPGKGILNQLRKVVMMSRKAGKRIARFRSDSAAHNLDIFLFCEKNDIRFFVSLEQNAVVRREAKGISEKKWKQHPDREGLDYAESTHAICKTKKRGSRCEPWY